MYFKLHFSRYSFVAILALFELTGFMKSTSAVKKKTFPVPKIDLEPHTYVIYRTNQPLKIDGKLNEAAWKKASWTNYFVNIEGKSAGAAKQKTRVKLLWNEKYLYIGAELEEKNIWATMTKRDAPLYQENAFELFIDSDEDTQHYLEFGINAMGTIYDLLLPKPYRDGGHAISAFNILGIKSAISIDGTINNPADTDTKWTLEIALPIKALDELNLLGNQSPPKPGDQWRVQFARAERKLTVSGDKYELKKDSQTGKPLPSIYTSWAPQGLVNLHYPEMWGFVQFSNIIAGKDTAEFSLQQDEKIKWALRKVYYQQKQYYLNHDSYTANHSKLGIDKINAKGFDFSPKIHATKVTFLALSHGFKNGTIWYINQNGKVWKDHH
jgi:hypothetical protein